MLDEETQQLVLHVREVERFGVECRQIRERVQFEVMERQIGFGAGHDLRQHPDAGPDLSRVGWMGNEVRHTSGLFQQGELGTVRNCQYRDAARLDHLPDVAQPSHGFVAEFDHEHRPLRDGLRAGEFEAVDRSRTESTDGERRIQLLGTVLGEEGDVHVNQSTGR